MLIIMINGLGYKLANVPTITGLATVTADIINTEAVNTDQLYVDGADVTSIVSQVPINTANIAVLQQKTTDMSYNSITDTTSFNNNVDINLDLYTAGNITCEFDFNCINGSVFTSYLKNLTGNSLYLITDNSIFSVQLRPNNILAFEALDNAINIYQNTNMQTKNITNAGSITATTFNGYLIGDVSGNVTGSATTATTSTTTNNIALTSDNTAGTYYIPFSKTTSTTSNTLFIDNTTTPLTYNPNTSTLTATNFNGLASASTTSAVTVTNIGADQFVPCMGVSTPTAGNYGFQIAISAGNNIRFNNATGALTVNKYFGDASSLSNVPTSITLTNLGTNQVVPLINTPTATAGNYQASIGASYANNLFFDNSIGKMSCKTITTLNGANSTSFYQSGINSYINNAMTSGSLLFATSDASAVNATRFQISATSVQSNTLLTVVDIPSSDLLGFQATTTSGNWNPNTPAGISLIYAKSTAVDTQSLGLTVWSNTNTGLLINPINVRLGHGGTGATPTSYIDCSGGTTTIEGTIINVSAVNATRLQINSTNIQANIPLSIFDSATSDLLGFQAVATATSFNPNTPAGSSLIYAKSTTIDTQSLGLTVWSNTNTGLLINPINVRLGHGGTGATPTSYIDCSGGITTLEGATAINIRPKNFQFATSTGTTFTIGNGGATVNQTNLIMTNTSARTVAYTTGQNVVIGTDAAATTTTTFAASVIVGYGAGNTITSATDNICIGNIAGGGTTTGGANIFIGSGSGFQNSTTGTGGSNTCIGTQAGAGMTTTANGNCLIGAGVASAITTGANNTCIGTNSGDNITTGSSNITIGNLATVPTATSSNQIAIGTSSDTMFIRGGFNWRVGADITASITLTAPLAQYYSVTISAAAQTITLPAPNNTTLLGQRIMFKRKTNNVQFTITSVGGGLVFIPVNNITLGTTQVVTTTVFQIELVCDGSAWAVVSIA